MDDIGFLVTAFILKLDQVHLACRTQFGDLESIFLWMKRRSAKDKVFRPSKLSVNCPIIREF